LSRDPGGAMVRPCYMQVMYAAFPTADSDVASFVDTMRRFVAWTLILADRTEGPGGESLDELASDILVSIMDGVWGNRAHSRQMSGADLKYIQAAVVQWHMTRAGEL
jgi:hypothetical protein